MTSTFTPTITGTVSGARSRSRRHTQPTQHGLDFIRRSINAFRKQTRSGNSKSQRAPTDCISLSANPANSGGDAGIEPGWSRLRGECISHLCQSPLVQEERIDFSVLDDRSRTRPSSYFCNLLVRRSELNPHRSGAGQLFWSVELPA